MSRPNERLAGVLLLAGIITALASTALSQGHTAPPDGLAGIADNRGRLLLAATLQVATAMGAVGIALALYPAIRRHYPTLGVSSVAFRGVEATFHAVAALGLMVLVGLSHPGAGLLASDSAMALGALEIARNAATYVISVIAFAIGSMLYYVAMYRARLVPRWLAGWLGDWREHSHPRHRWRSLRLVRRLRPPRCRAAPCITDCLAGNRARSLAPRPRAQARRRLSSRELPMSDRSVDARDEPRKAKCPGPPPGSPAVVEPGCSGPVRPAWGGCHRCPPANIRATLREIRCRPSKYCCRTARSIGSH